MKTTIVTIAIFVIVVIGASVGFYFTGKHTATKYYEKREDSIQVEFNGLSLAFKGKIADIDSMKRRQQIVQDSLLIYRHHRNTASNAQPKIKSRFDSMYAARKLYLDSLRTKRN